MIILQKLQMVLKYMNKYDFILISILIIISIILICLFVPKKINKVNVYYDNKLVKTIDLNVDSEYDIKGLNGNIHIVVKNKELRVTDEISPLHICRKQVLKSSNDIIVCLPNHIVIKSESNLDTVVGG